jgi:hypothetical protein
MPLPSQRSDYLEARASAYYARSNLLQVPERNLRYATGCGTAPRHGTYRVDGVSNRFFNMEVRHDVSINATG